MTTWEPDAVTSTFLANALPAAAGCTAIDVLREEGSSNAPQSSESEPSRACRSS